MSPAGLAWGGGGHRWVTARALDSLAEPLRGFFAGHRETLLRQCTAADARKDRDPAEGPRHYVDVEEYPASIWNQTGMDEPGLLLALGEEAVRERGTGPWSAAATFGRLVAALRNRDLEGSLQQASDLAHYVADLHQPLHTTRNHDGQLTGQKGLHARLESQVLNRFLERLHFRPRPAADLGEVQTALNRMVLETHRRVPAILEADRRVVARLDIQRPGSPGWQRGNNYPEEYFRLMFQETEKLLEERLNEAAHRLASLWWMAWDRSGRPEF